MLELLFFLAAVAQAPGQGPGPTSAPVAAPKAQVAITGVADVTVVVTHVGPSGSAPAAGAPVTLQALPAQGDTPLKDWFAVADSQGRAVLTGVGVIADARYVASAIGDGVTYDARPVPLRVGQEVTIPVKTYPVSGDDSAIQVARVFTRVGLWEAQLEIHQAWTFVNAGKSTYDPKKGSRTGEKGLLIRLPEGVSGAQVKGMPEGVYEIAGNKVLYTGLLRPGPQGSVEVQLSFAVEYKEGVYAFAQPSAYTIDESMVIVPDVPTVRHRRLDGVRLSVGVHNHEHLESATERGGAVWVLSGKPTGTDLRFEVAGLPHYDERPAWGAVVVGVAIIVWGLFRILTSRGGAPGNAPAEPPPISVADATILRERREKLMQRLMGLEGDQGSFDPAEFARRRDAVKRRLIDVDRQLEGAS